MILRSIIPSIGRLPETIIETVLSSDRRVLLFGAPGCGKSTLATELARALRKAGRRCLCLGADPGSPAFGIPGAVCRGEWLGEGWAVSDFEAVCSLDAGRFRLPLVSALRRLAERAPLAPLLVDAPGIVRGVTGAELLFGVVEAAHIDVVLVLVREGEAPPLQRELRALPAELFVVQAAPDAARPGKRLRAQRRTKLWNAYLDGAEERFIDIGSVQLIGTPPPVDVDKAWPGRQVALLDGQNKTLALGEVVSKKGSGLRVKMPRVQTEGRLLLVRDAQRTKEGWLNTAKPYMSATIRYAPPPDMTLQRGYAHVVGPRPVAHVGMATTTLINGIFGDPLLHLRLRHKKRSLLFDLGEAGRLPARIAHQVTDIFISHAHIDHIGGFLWLLRSRIGYFPICRIVGPPGLAGHIRNLVHGIHWDRIGDRGPAFDVAELHGERLLLFRIKPDKLNVDRLGEKPVTDGVILDEPDFRLRAITLDHGIPVLAFAFEPSMQLNVRKERLKALGLPPGPWLGELKKCIYNNDGETMIAMPDGRIKTAGILADELVIITTGQKLVYAADMGDTQDNRKRLVEFATGAHTFFCEASFIEADAALAETCQHLTARACGEIASAAGVERLVPFHFSKRYENEPERIYEEVRAACSRVVAPRSLDASFS